MEKPQKIIIFCAPSGGGKTTIVRAMMERFPELGFSISATSRSMRPGETDGIEYHFLTADEFKKRADNDDFVEWEEVYPGLNYGTLKSELDRMAKRGKVVVFDVDVKGGVSLKKIFSDHALLIFIKAPYELIEKRLRARGTETEDKIKTRMARVEEELSYESRADVVIENIVLADALLIAEKVISEFLEE